jgi:DNA-binding IclR family transcriptional regulator
MTIPDTSRPGAEGEPPAPVEPAASGVLARTVAILEAVENGSRSLASITRTTGLSKTTTRRLLKSLETHGLLASGGGQGYRLGPRLLRIAAASLHQVPLRAIARPTLQRLASFTGETAQLWVASIGGRVCIDVVQSSSELRAIVEIGTELPVTAGSAGKIFMAWAPPAARAELVKTATAVTENTPIGETLERQLNVARRNGWASSAGERQPGVGSVSAPILGPHGELLAVLSIAGPTTRITRIGARRFAPGVMEAAREIERALGVER